MRLTKSPPLVLVALGALAVSTASAQVHEASDWHRFRGPNGQGICGEAALPLQWSAEKDLTWTTPLPGPGSSSPIVVGDKVLVTCCSGYGTGPDAPGGMDDLTRHLLCVNLADGEILWKKDVTAKAAEDRYRGYLREHGYASNTPVSDGEHVYAFFGKSGVHAFDLEGKQLWNTGVGTSSADRRWGSGASPILYENLLIVNAADEGRALIALNKKTGEEEWRYESRNMSLAYGTPIIVEPEGKSSELVIAVPGTVRGFDPLTGKLLWWANACGTGNICPSPVLWNETVIINGGYPRKFSTSIQLGGRGDVSESHVLWTGRATTYVPTPVVHEDHLYWIDERGIARCQEAKTGEETWSERLELEDRGMRCYASPILSDGNVIAVTRHGGTIVFKANPKEYEQVARNVIEGDSSQFNATPAASDGKLLLRSDQALYCVGVN